MWGTPENSVYTKSRQPLSSKFFASYKVRIESLASDNTTKAQLQQHYGDNWATVLEKKYQKIAQDKYLNDDQYEGLTNPGSRRLEAALFPRYTLPFQSFHERAAIRKNDKVICSEFVAKSLLENLETLNKGSR